MLRVCLTAAVGRVLRTLPKNLDETYARAMDMVEEYNWEYVQRLLKFLIAAVRPLRIAELAELLAVDFIADPAPEYVLRWRPPKPEVALKMTCLTLIRFDMEADVVEFAHHSVKEYLLSGRIKESIRKRAPRFYCKEDSAHVVAAQVCLATLLGPGTLDTDENTAYPLKEYAARNWITHARYKNAVAGLKEGMKLLFDPNNKHFALWVEAYDVDFDPLYARPEFVKPQPLYYAALCGFRDLTEHLLVDQHEDPNVHGGKYGTSLHAAAARGHLEVVRLLLDHSASINDATGSHGSALQAATLFGHTAVVQLLRERGATSQEI